MEPKQPFGVTSAKFWFADFVDVGGTDRCDTMSGRNAKKVASQHVAFDLLGMRRREL